MTERNEGADALQRARNEGLERQQEKLRDPDHLTPDEDDGGDPEPVDARQADEDAASIERLKNPPQVKGPRERGNRMV